MEGGEYQSIYNLHELFITLTVSSIDSPKLPLTGKLDELDESFAKSAKHDLTDKSVNGQNCRKSALLS